MINVVSKPETNRRRPAEIVTLRPPGSLPGTRPHPRRSCTRSAGGDKPDQILAGTDHALGSTPVN
jgi:hypothetical protein